MLTLEEPLNNIVRVAYEVMSIVLGGAQAIHSGSYDEAYAIPTEQAQLIALRTQQILAYETGVADTVDPLGGSHYVEALTDWMEVEIKRIMDRIDVEWGGIVKAIENGDLQRNITQRAYEAEKQLRSGEGVVVGVNRFHGEGGREEIEIHRADPESVRRQVGRVKRVKASRDNARVERALAELRKAAQGTENTMPCIVGAVREYATVGEITGVLREVWGEFKEPVRF